MSRNLFTASEVDLHVGQVMYDVTSLQATQSFGETRIQYETNVVTNITKMVLILPSGTSLEIKIYPRMLMSTATSGASASAEVFGLLGNADGNPSNDFIARNGSIISADSNEEKIYYGFGQSCKFL